MVPRVSPVLASWRPESEHVVERFLGTIGVGTRPVRDKRTSTMQSCVFIANDSNIFSGPGQR
jgi:hypothetical protein